MRRRIRRRSMRSRRSGKSRSLEKRVRGEQDWKEAGEEEEQGHEYSNIDPTILQMKNI